MFYYLSLKRILNEDFKKIFVISFLVFISAILELISLLMISFIITNAGQLNEVLVYFNNAVQVIYPGFLMENLSSVFLLILSYISLSVIVYLVIIRYASFKVHSMIAKVRSKIIYQLLDENFYEDIDRDKSKVISNIIYDASQFGASLIDLVHLISRLCLTLVILVWLIFVNPLITTTIASILIFLYAAIHLIITPKIRFSGNNIAVFNELLIKELSNFFGYIREIIFYNIQGKVTKELGGINTNIAESTGSKSFLVNMPRFIVDSLLLVILGSFVLIANSTKQDFVIFYGLLATYGIASIKLLPAVQNIFYYSQQILARRPNIVNLNHFFEGKLINGDDIYTPKSLTPELQDKIKLTNISYHSKNKEDILINNL